MSTDLRPERDKGFECLGGGESATTKTFVDGTHRVRAPAETVGRLRPMLRRFGITRVADVTGLDHIGIPVVMVCRPNARGLAVAQGKGATLDAAKASGIMEAIEIEHAEEVDLPVRFATYRHIRRSGQVIDPDALARPTTSTFGSDQRLPWIEAVGVASGQPCWLPFELVDLDFTIPDPFPRGAFSANSNGLASGNSRIEATVHALCEVIERDAEMMWAIAGEPEDTRVDPDSVDDPACRWALDCYEQADVDVAIWDMTSDVGIATYRVAIADRSPMALRRVFHAEGSGTHPDRSIALLRSLTEAAQSRLTLIAGSHDDQSRDDYRSMRASDLMAQARTEMWSGAGRRSHAEAPSCTNETLDGDLTLILDRLDSCGIPEPLVVDLTRPDVGIPVVKVVVPTMEPDTEIAARPGMRARAAMARHADEVRPS